MRFGTAVLVRRGSRGNLAGTPGCLRSVRGIYVGAYGNCAIVRLLEDDPLATVGYCTKAGDVGQWSDSCVSPDRS